MSVQWVLGHALLSTTQIYTTPLPEDVITGVLAHHARCANRAAPSSSDVGLPMASYRPQTLNILFGEGTA